MSSLTPNYNLIKPGVNDPTDQDQWGGMLNEDMDIIDSTMKSISDSVQSLYPVGSVYVNASVNTNPATLFGFGTWVAFGAGRVLLGVGSGTDSNGIVRAFANGDTGGEYEHEQTINELVPHDHPQSAGGVNNGNGAAIGVARGVSGGSISENGVYPRGGGDPMPWMQPYITVYMWVRTV